MKWFNRLIDRIFPVIPDFQMLPLPPLMPIPSTHVRLGSILIEPLLKEPRSNTDRPNAEFGNTCSEIFGQLLDSLNDEQLQLLVQLSSLLEAWAHFPLGLDGQAHNTYAISGKYLAACEILYQSYLKRQCIAKAEAENHEKKQSP